jgi:hypothetical protein
MTGEPAAGIKVPGIRHNWVQDKVDGNAFSGEEWNKYYFKDKKVKAQLHKIFKAADGKAASVSGVNFDYKKFNAYPKKNINSIVIIEFYTDGFVGIYYKMGEIVYFIPIPPGVAEQVRDLSKRQDLHFLPSGGNHNM